MNAHRMTDPDDVTRYLLGGRATLTLKSARTGARRTFRVRSSDRPELYFVDLLSGADNEHDYRYLGCFTVKPTLVPRSINRLRWGEDAWRIFRWFLRQIVYNREFHPELEVWHEGRCSKCARPLTDPESIARGIGPVCYSSIH